jgi:hypothetical protein
MSGHWIDVFSPGGGPDVPGSKLGSGPIRAALDWESQRQLDAVGSFSFTMPASDPKAALIRPRRVVYCYTVVDVDDPAAPSYSAILPLGSGIIEKIDTEEGPPLLLRVSGSDLLGELAGRTVGQLSVLKQDWASLAPVDGVSRGAVRYLYATSSTDDELTEAFDGSTGTSTSDVTFRDDAYIYIGYDARFDAIRWNLGATVNTTAVTATDNLLGQYYNELGSWASLTVTSNGTSAAGAPNIRILEQDGDVVFTRPTDWARSTPTENSGNWFWTRWYRANGVGNNFDVNLTEITVYADVPTKGGVNLIMAHAPTAWGVSGYPDTQSAHYVAFDGESVINALITLTEHGGQIPQ